MDKSKKVISCMLAIVIMFTTFANTTAFAMGGPKTYLNEYTYSGDEVYQELRLIGFTDEEMIDLFQKEANNTGQNFKLPKALVKSTGTSYVFSEGVQVFALPGNPYIGMRHQEEFNINFNKLAIILGAPGAAMGISYILVNCTKTQIARALVNSLGFGMLGSALSVAGFILTLASINNDGMKVTIDYLYTYGNDGLPGWVVGPINYNFY